MKDLNNHSRRKFITQATASLAGLIIVPRHVLGGSSQAGVRFLAPSDKINLGIIGIGKQGKGLANSFLNTGEARIAAISEVYKAKGDLGIEKMKDLHEKNKNLGTFEVPSVYKNYQELLERKDIDAVVIATPDHQHAVMAVASAYAGKDIFCEKPLSLTVMEGRAMVNATRVNNRVFQTGSMQRSWPEFRQAAELIRNGYLGKIKHIKVNVGEGPIKYDLPEQNLPSGLDWDLWLGPNQHVVFNEELAPPVSKDVFPNWRKYTEFGGGQVTDWGAHMFDIVQWALEMDHSGPSMISPPDGKEHKFLTFKYKNGITVSHEKWEWNNAIHFIGEEGDLKIQRRKIETSKAELATRIISDSEKHVYKSENHYKDFLQAMRDRKSPICDVEIGHRTASMCSLANIAYALGRPLKWNPKKEQFIKDAEANMMLGRKMNDKFGIKI